MESSVGPDLEFDLGLQLVDYSKQNFGCNCGLVDCDGGTWTKAFAAEGSWLRPGYESGTFEDSD